ncbi:MAG: hypothetical protein L3J63_05285 [Geopsychrobacter sp.]|nr:hypothetical protein [Geopsychrobacter sp.]
MLTALLLVTGSFLSQALAGTIITGRSSTEIEWFDDPNGDTAAPVLQYLQFNALNMADKGWDFRGYGRFSTDSRDKVDSESRLYYAYVQKKGLAEGLDVKIGRQFLTTAAGASLMDGIHLDYDLPFAKKNPLTFTLFGGGDVSYYSGYNTEDLITGGELAGTFFKSLSTRVSYLQRWGDGDLTNEMFGLDLDYDYKGMLNLYSELQYDWLTASTSYFLAGADFHRSQKWSLRTEYLYSLPVFSSTSIYSVFAVNEYEELMAELNYRIANGLRAFGRLTYEMYPEFDNATVLEAGIEKIRTNRISGYLSGVWREDGDGGQDMAGAKARCRYMINKMFQAGAGAEIDVLQRRLEINYDDTLSSRYWLDLTTYLSKKINIEAKIERSKSDLWNEYYQGRVRLNIIF